MLVVIATVPRILGAFFLPNTFGDAYVYIRDIGALSTKLKSGTFAITDLYGFWLPLYQFVSALINVFVGNGFYVGKIVSAMFGVGVCLLVYAITIRLVEHKIAALLAFLLIALNPLHILNSTSAMTDVPHAFFVLACAFFVLKRNWAVGAVFAALAGLTRVESWMLVALIPLVQIWKERRVSISPVLIMLVPPLFWFYVSWKATGDWLACFRARQQYHDWLLTQNPALTQFSPAAVVKDLAMFVSGVDLAVLCGASVAAWLVLRKLKNRIPIDGDSKNADRISVERVLPLVVFFFAFFALLLLAYVTNQQPIMFPRYGLILFSLGIPILAWTYFAIVGRRPQWSRRVLNAIVVLCLLNMAAQFAGGVGELNRYRAQRRVADYLRDHFDVKSGTNIFCDEGTVRALSGIPADRFVTSSGVPRDYKRSPVVWREWNVEWLVITSQSGSFPAPLFQGVEHGKPIGPYESVSHARSQFLPMTLHVYRRIR